MTRIFDNIEDKLLPVLQDSFSLSLWKERGTDYFSSTFYNTIFFYCRPSAILIRIKRFRSQKPTFHNGSYDNESI